MTSTKKWVLKVINQKNVAQSEEALLEEIQEETHNEELEDEAPSTPDDDTGSVDYPSLQDAHNDIQVDDHDVLSYLLHNDNAKHDDHWSSFGLPLYDSS